MDKNITMTSGLTIGLDLGDKSTVGCIFSPSGEVVETFTVSTTMSALGRTMDGFDASRVVLEVGTHSPWISRLVERSGHEVIIANPRRGRRTCAKSATPRPECSGRARAWER
jgi:transposase